MGLCMADMDILRMDGVVGEVHLLFDMRGLIQGGFCIAIRRMMTVVVEVVVVVEEEYMDAKMKLETIRLLVLKLSLLMWMVNRIRMARRGLGDGVGGGKGVRI